MKKYGVILADPPWSYADSRGFGWDRNAHLYAGNRSVTNHYETMTMQEIADLPIKEMTADNCALFLWAVWPFIFDMKWIIEAWGFEYKAVAWVWSKLNESSLGFAYGLGYYTRANTEPCLLAIRGSMPPAVKDVQALIVSPVREHSRKPDEQYGKIERLYPNVPKLELFARRKHPGWDVWGNEVESDVKIF